VQIPAGFTILRGELHCQDFLGKCRCETIASEIIQTCCFHSADFFLYFSGNFSICSWFSYWYFSGGQRSAWKQSVARKTHMQSVAKSPYIIYV